eukprot:UN0456
MWSKIGCPTSVSFFFCLSVRLVYSCEPSSWDTRNRKEKERLTAACDQFLFCQAAIILLMKDVSCDEIVRTDRQ